MTIDDLDKEINRRKNFTHPPIDTRRQIRLLRISLPEEEDDDDDTAYGNLPQQPIAATDAHYTIEVVDVADLHRTRYRALSYIWGPAQAPDDVREIHIGGNGGGQQPFAVRRNLADFLATAAGKRVAGLFFVDAVCIDQLCHAEREAQVQLMERVFRNADEVVAWLGRLDDDDDDGDADNVRALARAISDEKGNYGITRDGCGCCSRPRRRRRPEDWTAIEWAGFRYLSYHAYWGRIWIVQEIQLASHATVWCGFFTFPLSLFGTSPSSSSPSSRHAPLIRFGADGRPWTSQGPGARARSPAETIVTHRLRLVLRPARDPLFSGTLDEMTTAVASSGGTVVFETYQSRVPDLLHQIVRKFGGLACSDPRDRLYGLLGLLHERSRALITPDYSRGVDHAVYQALRAGLLEIHREQWPVLGGASTATTTADIYYGGGAGRGYVDGEDKICGSDCLAYYCDVRDAFGIPDSRAAALLRRVLDELDFRNRWVDAVTFRLCDNGWDGGATAQFASDVRKVLGRAECQLDGDGDGDGDDDDDDDDCGTIEVAGERPWLLRFHERERRAVQKL
ncbi:hypothetical protein MGN70_008799 [Eutypa lata]|nr:hypothetical protein MGN70_008799 [Eutypa lata]